MSEGSNNGISNGNGNSNSIGNGNGNGNVVRDRITGALGVLLAGGYIAYARSIEDSLLADAVGAAGVPTGVGVTLLLASGALLLKTVWLRPTAKTASAASAETVAANPTTSLEPASTSPEPEDANTTMSAAPVTSPYRSHALALGLLALLVGYTVVLPIVGYVLAVGLLIAAVAKFAGARGAYPLLACGIGGGIGLWLLFAVVLSVRMPAGLWPLGLGA